MNKSQDKSQMIYQLMTGPLTVIYLGDNCIQNFNLGRYIVGYTVASLVLGVIFEGISDDMPPKMKILNMVIPIIMHFCSFLSNWSIVSRLKPHHIQRNVT